MISVDLHTFCQSRESGNVTGVIYINLNLGAFPEIGWSDFPVIVLSWWAEALLKLETSAKREVLWRFMDGPHCLTLTKVRRIVPTGALPYGEIKSGLLEAGQRVVSHCERQKMFGRDLETLRANIQRLNVNQKMQRIETSRPAHIEIRPSASAGFRR